MNLIETMTKVLDLWKKKISEMSEIMNFSLIFLAFRHFFFVRWKNLAFPNEKSSFDICWQKFSTRKFFEIWIWMIFNLNFLNILFECGNNVVLQCNSLPYEFFFIAKSTNVFNHNTQNLPFHLRLIPQIYPVWPFACGNCLQDNQHFLVCVRVEKCLSSRWLYLCK